MRWFRRSTSYIDGSPGALAELPEMLTAWERGNVTDAHRRLLDHTPHGSGATWSEQALWACVDRLSTSLLTEASHIRLVQGWTDGDEAFCLIYPALHDSDVLVDVRRHRSDANVREYRVGGLYHGTELCLPDDDPDPAAFGRTVADFDIGEPLGTRSLVQDAKGVGWYGSIDALALPRPPGPANGG